MAQLMKVPARKLDGLSLILGSPSRRTELSSRNASLCFSSMHTNLGHIRQQKGRTAIQEKHRDN